MIDSVLKGTGNSRFLKSAVPAGTSWADALAMLQAGTFPIDFNGINTEGFQQVGTPLNKANLLKDATAAQIGLPPSTTPDGMFQALGKTGELHVWRKTVVTKEPVPEVSGSYTLGTAQRRLIGTRTTSQTNIQSVIKNISRSNSITVDLEGNVSLDNPSTFSVQIAPWNGSGTIRDVFGDYKYIEFTDTTEGSYCNPELPRNTVFLVNPDSTFIGAGYGSGEKAYIYDAQEVIGVPGHPYIPAGTTTTYPVSTNPNAYQEGEYGKAGYTLGDVKTGTFQIGQGATTIAANRAIIKYGASVSVTDTGTASIASESELMVTSDSSQSAVDKLKGKFFRFSQLPFSSSAFSVGTIYFFPANTVFTKQSSGNWSASKYQTVTSHGKTEPEYTIEYLGKLGDKARVQVVSYVGTGTYGKDNPNSLTFDFAPKFFAIMKDTSNRNHHTFAIRGAKYIDYKNDSGNNTFSYLTWEGKKISWYAYNNDATYQFNFSGSTYYVLAIG